MQTANSWTFKEKVEKRTHTQTHARNMIIAGRLRYACIGVSLFFIIIEYKIIIPYFVPRLNSMGEHACSLSTVDYYYYY